MSDPSITTPRDDEEVSPRVYAGWEESPPGAIDDSRYPEPPPPWVNQPEAVA